MGDIVTLAELRVKARVPTGNDAELNQIIDEVERRFQGEIGQLRLIQTTYANEKHDGNNSAVLELKNRPLVSVTSASIENEGAIDTTNVGIVRFLVWPDSVQHPARLTFPNRIWSFDPSRPHNVTVSYVAGFPTQADIKRWMPFAWTAVLTAASQLWFDMRSQERGIASQAHMGGAISYFDPQLLGERFHDRMWLPAVRRYRRRHVQIGRPMEPTWG